MIGCFSLEATNLSFPRHFSGIRRFLCASQLVIMDPPSRTTCMSAPSSANGMSSSTKKTCVPSDRPLAKGIEMLAALPHKGVTFVDVKDFNPLPTPFVAYGSVGSFRAQG